MISVRSLEPMNKNRVHKMSERYISTRWPFLFRILDMITNSSIN